MSFGGLIYILTKTGYLLRFRLVACLPEISTAAMTVAQIGLSLSTADRWLLFYIRTIVRAIVCYLPPYKLTLLTSKVAPNSGFTIYCRSRLGRTNEAGRDVLRLCKPSCFGYY